MKLFHPLGFMLASPVDTPEEAVARFTATVRVPHPSQPQRDGWDVDSSPTEDINPVPPMIHAFLEDKYDGMRAQLHCGDPAQPGRVALYSRNREDITGSFPELAEAFAHVDPNLDGPLVFDGEILGWDFGRALETQVPSNGVDPLSLSVFTREARPEPHEVPHALPFAVLGQRIGRKRVTNEMRSRIPVVFMAFDLLYANGELTLDLPMRERRNRLEAIAQRLIPRTVSPLELAAPDPPNRTCSHEQRRMNNQRPHSPASSSPPPVWSNPPPTSTMPTPPRVPAPTRGSWLRPPTPPTSPAAAA